MLDILHRVGIRAYAQKVFAALSEEHGLAGWWTKDVKASPAVGAINQFRFGDQGFKWWSCGWCDGLALRTARLERAGRIHALLQHEVGNVSFGD